MSFGRRLPAVSPPKYPSNYPCPSLQGYSFSLKHDISETKMQNGWTVRRQREPYSIRTASLTFQMTSAEFFGWYNFAVGSAYKWIRMQVQTERTRDGSGSPNTRYETLRFISPISYSYNDFDGVQAQVQCEFYLNEITGDFE